MPLLLRILEARSRELDAAFFRPGTAALRERLRDQAGGLRDALARVSGITDRDLLDRLTGLEIHADTLAAFTLIPLLDVAWADGHMHERERRAILHAAQGIGIGEDSPSHGLLRLWIESPPDPELAHAWRAFIEAVCRELSVDARVRLREHVVGRARRVAEAAGGLLGVGSVSRSETETLDRLENAFTHWDSIEVTYADGRRVPPAGGAASRRSRPGAGRPPR